MRCPERARPTKKAKAAGIITLESVIFPIRFCIHAGPGRARPTERRRSMLTK